MLSVSLCAYQSKTPVGVVWMWPACASRRSEAEKAIQLGPVQLERIWLNQEIEPCSSLEANHRAVWS